MQALSLALAKIIEGGGCTKCLIKEVARTVTIYAKELCAAKRNGEWTREEKKALKREAKATFQEVKGEVKETWRGKD